MTTLTETRPATNGAPLGDAPMVSVIVPTHNRAAQLADALTALWAQQYPTDRYEVIIIDDGSSDDTPAVIERLVPQAPCRVITQRTTGLGAAAARNLGMRLASGEIMAHTDDDCRVPEAWIAAGAAGFTNNVAIVFGPIWSKPEHQKSFFSWIQEQDKPTGTYPTSNIFYRSDAARSIGLFDESYGGNLLGRPRWGWDNDFAYRLLRLGYTAHFEQQAYCYTDVVTLSPVEWLKTGWRHSMIPDTVKGTPELRHTMLKWGIFNDAVSWTFELGLLATLLSRGRGMLWLLAWLPWLRVALAQGRGDWFPPSRWGFLGVKLMFTFLMHSIRFAALVYGSVRAKTVVL